MLMTMIKDDSHPGETDIMKLLARGVQISAVSNSYRCEISDYMYFFKFVMLSDCLCLIKLTRDMGKDANADEGTLLNTAKFTSRLTKAGDRFMFTFDTNTLGVLGKFYTAEESKSKAEDANKNILMIEENLPTGFLAQSRPYAVQDGFGNIFRKHSKDVIEKLEIDYSEGVSTMKLIEGGRIIEIFLDDNLSNEDMEKKNLNYGLNRNERRQDEAVEGTENISALQRFQELRDKQNMRKAVNQLGKSNYFAYKITAISIKLLINVSAGILFYILIIGLFEMLNENLLLFSSISTTATSLIQTSYLAMEKILWAQGKLPFNSYEPSLGVVFSDLDTISRGLLKSVESNIIKSSTLVDSINLATPTDLWYKKSFFKLYKLGQSDPTEVNAKEGLSTLLSNALVHLEKPMSYYNENNKDLHVFFQNCRKGLFDAISTFLTDVNNKHTEYSESRRTLLLTLLLGKIGLGCIFIAVAFVLYFKENKRKEEVIALFYSFSPSDVKWLLQVNEKLISVILLKDFSNSDAGLEHSKLIEYRETDKIPVPSDEIDDDQSRQIMMAKRNKSRGRLDRLVDFNKFFIVFFAAINTLYFIFLYLWNVNTYSEYWGLMRFSRGNDLLSLEINSRFSKMMNVLYNPMTENTLDRAELDYDISQYNNYRKECLFELLGNKYSSSSSFNNVYALFFNNGCEYLEDRKDICTTVRDGDTKRGYFMIASRFMSDIAVYNMYQLYLKDNQTGQPPWMFSTHDTCSQAMIAKSSYTNQDAWDCFLKSKDLEDTRNLHR